uniref:DUF6770 family protein n=1 Tax=Flavobacterium sp. TaxID=239 RepID=UPI004048FD7C
MKKITFLILLFSTALFSQVQKLSALSKGKFIDSRVIFDDNSEDVFGYILLYELDAKSREVSEFEYIVLDKNLNILTSNSFIQGLYRGHLVKTGPKFSYIKKIKNELFFGLHDTTPSMQLNPYVTYLFNHRYRKLNLIDFTLSEEFVIEKDMFKERISKVGDNYEMMKLLDFQSIIPTKSEHFVLFSDSEYKLPTLPLNFEKQLKKKHISIKNFSLLDHNLKIVWTKQINGDDEVKGNYTYVTSDSTTLVIKKESYDKKLKENFVKISYLIYDIKTGNEIGVIPFEDVQYKIPGSYVSIKDDKLIFYGFLYRLDDKNLATDTKVGYVKMVIDKKTGKELKRNYFLMTDLQPHLNMINTYGYMPDYGKLTFHEFLSLKNGNTIGIAEIFDFDTSSTTIKELCVVEFDADMKIKYFKNVPKQINKLSVSLWTSGQIRLYDYFDYFYSQKLDNQDNYVFFYANNEKEGRQKDKLKNPNWILGIITYVDGEFNYDKIQLTNINSQIIPGMAKNGYVKLMEISEKEIEVRLEKVNY